MKFLILFVLLGISTAAAQAPLGKLLAKRYPMIQNDDQTLVLISFSDKGRSKTGELRRPESLLSDRSLRRRMKVRDAAHVVDEQDLPLEQAYVRAVASRVASVRHQLKWFNGVSAMATKSEIDEVRKLGFVREIELLGRWRVRKDDEQPEPLEKSPRLEAPAGTTDLSYGTSFTQVNQINVPALHNLGFYGQGVVIAVFDNGFRNLAHQAFDSMHIIATYDFVDHKVGVAPNNLSTGFGSHGVWTLSTIGGNKSGSLIGPAFKSDYILARTENDSSETPIEEDNWAKAIEWADSIGVDVTSCSLGYLGFDAPYPGLTWADMNGHTALVTKAADRAVGLGIVVVNSAGNEGFNASRNTLIAPADGDSVIAAGAVTSAGVRTSFSSVGPTTDNPPRIKPDVMAMGSGVKTASATDTVNYVSVSGTSFSCPLSAGVAALLLCANPSLTPMQVRDAMRQTASNSCSPNNLMGWGILNALAAMKYSAVAPVGVISGTVFEDMNGNSVKDAGEPGLQNIKVRLSCTAVESTLTDAGGAYSFGTLRVGGYSVAAALPAGYARSVPLSGSFSVTVDSANPGVPGKDFGNYHPGSIRGMKFNDANNSGVRDSGEAGLMGWVIKLSGPQAQRVTTDSAGAYRFTGMAPGLFAVQESTKAGWDQSSPGGDGSYSILMRSGLDTIGLDFGNYFNPPNGYSVSDGWNLLSLPQDPTVGHGKSAIYFTAISRAFSYANSSGYSVLDPIPNGVGFWLKFSGTQNIGIPGNFRTADSIEVAGGWNLIGSLSLPVAISAIVQIPAGNVVSPFFPYRGNYILVDSLSPHEGYFVKVKGTGKLYINSSSAAAVGGGEVSSIRHDLDETAGRITIQNSKGVRQVLYFGRSDALRAYAGFFDLPPTPPEDAFDARFSSGSMVWIPRPGDPTDAATINVQCSLYPLNVSWKIPPSEGAYSLTVGPRSHPTELAGSGSITVSDPGTKVLRLQSGGEGNSRAFPKQYGLEQNYPNPFNPSTSVEYRIPADGRVKLEIFNLIGQQVRVLVDKDQRAGSYTAEWDGRSSRGFGLTSGIYFVRLTVNSAGKQAFTSTKKMILMR